MKDDSAKLSAETRSPLYCDDKDDDDHSYGEEQDNDRLFLLKHANISNIDDGHNKSKRSKKSSRIKNRKSTKSILEALPSFIIQKRLINLRSILLASSLCLTLSVFWLLDSLKDPLLSTMVEGNLNKHQPLAKMASVGGTLVLVMLIELVSYGRKKRQAEIMKNMMTNDEVISSAGTWTKMSIESHTHNQQEYDREKNNSSNKIPLSIFRMVGVSYIVAFSILSYIISIHPDFDGSDSTSTASQEIKKKSVWYGMGYVQYVLIESYGSIAVATFWSFANSTLTLKAAKTFYGFIIAVAQLGAIGGSTIATIENISIPRLINMACIGILIQIGVMQIYGHYFPFPMHEDDDVIFVGDDDGHDFEVELEKKAYKARQNQRPQNHPNIVSTSKQIIMKEGEEKESLSSGTKLYFSGVYLILKHNYLLLILGVSCLYEVSLTCLDYEMKLIGLDHFSSPPDMIGEFGDVHKVSESKDMAEAFTTFMGRFGQLTNALSLLLSYYLFPYLMANYGLKNTIRLFPTLLLFVTITTFIALPMNLPVLFISMSILKAMTYSINDPAKEILYIPTSNTVKFKAKFWIDVVGARVAKAIGSSINTYAGTAERIVQYGSLPSVLAAVALWIVCYAAGIKFDELISCGAIVGIVDDESENVDLFSAFDDDESHILGTNNNVSSFDEASESGWESNVSVELVHLKSSDHKK